MYRTGGGGGRCPAAAPFLVPLRCRCVAEDAQKLSAVPLESYDLVLADPPYSVEDAERYRTTMVKRNIVLSALRRVAPGTHVVWLDQVLPMYRKDAFAIEAVIEMVKSTNHRFRVVTVFHRLQAAERLGVRATPGRGRSAALSAGRSAAG